MNQEEFEQKSKQRRKENTDELTKEVLALMLKRDINMFDTHYIRDRAIQIVQETIKKINFKNEEIEKARRAFLDVLIDGLQLQMFTVDDEIEKVHGFVKRAKDENDKAKKQKWLEKLKALERVKQNTPQDATEERDINCEPICQHVSRAVLSKDWLLKDDEYIKGAMELDNELLVSINAMNYLNELFEQVYNSLDESYLRANEKHWGVPRTKIKLSQIDNRLKE